MLVLGRHAKQELHFDCPDGVRIVVTLLEIRRRKNGVGLEARIGIEAPLSVQISRPDARSQEPKHLRTEDAA